MPPFLITPPDHHAPSGGRGGETGEYRCDLCSCSYAQQRGLNRHKRERHDVSSRQTFMCSLCQRQYKRRYVLLEHMMKVHGVSHTEVSVTSGKPFTTADDHSSPS